MNFKESKKSKNKDIGNLGEQIACEFLRNKGFEVLQSNYWRRWGEIDIVAQKDSKVHFVEVKTVSHETRKHLKEEVARGTWRPEELVHRFKLGQISKALETWIAEHEYEGDWQIDVVAIRIVPRETYASVRYIENIVT